jgi:predicted CXXCH cytochrome family protein
MPVSAYTVYSSNSLQAKPGQPTGSSKLCLSCHDGTIALGSVLSRGQPIQMAGGITTLPPGNSNLGTDLSDDHPISFRYDANLATQNPKLKQPAQLPQGIHLDAFQELQCTACHEPHNNQFGKFLVMDNSQSQLCASCHNQGTTSVTGHMQCASCHQQHTAPSGPYLLRAENVTGTCLTCHSGQAGANQGPNIAMDLNKVSRHDTNSAVNLKDHVPKNVVCNDCHEPHTILAATGTAAPQISPRLGQISGVNSAGAAVPKAQYQYEVCFKCHADQQAALPTPAITRQIVQLNTRLEFDPSAVSFHPVEAAGRNASVPSLRPGFTAASLIYCTDCHASDTSKAAGSNGPDGPHGSSNGPLLIARYDTADLTSESASAYALCYRCHDRANILANTSFPQHSRHIVDARTPCSVCHDAHGISSSQGNVVKNSKLINFDTSIVRSVNVGGIPRLEYNSTGARAGQCFLSCHGVDHSPKAY